MNIFSSFFSSLQNAQRLQKPFIICKWSHKILRVLFFLKRQKLIHSFSVKDKELIYIHLIPGAFSSIRQISKSKCRVYKKSSQIRPSFQGLGIEMISTPLGLLTAREAKVLNVGGEMMCEIF